MAERTNIFVQKWNFKSTRAFGNILTLQGSLFIPLYPDWPLHHPFSRQESWRVLHLRFQDVTSPCLLRDEAAVCLKFQHMNAFFYTWQVKMDTKNSHHPALSFLLHPCSLNCFILYPLMWLMSGQTTWVSGEGEVRSLFELQPKPQTSSLEFLAQHHIIANGTLHSFAIVLCKFTGKGSCLNLRPRVPHPQCLTWPMRRVSTHMFVELREFEVSVMCEELKFLVKVPWSPQ